MERVTAEDEKKRLIRNAWPDNGMHTPIEVPGIVVPESGAEADGFNVTVAKAHQDSAGWLGGSPATAERLRGIGGSGDVAVAGEGEAAHFVRVSRKVAAVIKIGGG